MLTHGDRIASAKHVIECILRARRAVRIFPQSSPVIVKAYEELHRELVRLLSFQDRIAFEIRQDSILFELEEVFRPLSSENDMALFLYRDGVREVVFKKGLTLDEVQWFVNVVSAATAKEGNHDDIVTRMWEYEFKHIRCIIYEQDIFGEAQAEESAVKSIPTARNVSSELVKAYNDAAALEAEDGAPDSIEFSDDDLIGLRREIEKNSLDKTERLLNILLDLFLMAETDAECLEIEEMMRKTVEHALASRNIDVLADFFFNVKAAYMDPSYDSRFKANLSRIFSSFSSEKFLIKIGTMLDDGLRLEKQTFDKLAILLDKRSIPILIMLLGYLDTISARKTVVNILALVGKSDAAPLINALNDGRWYVVRNIVIVLRKIGDRQAKRYLLKSMDHKDSRVRREAIKAIAELSGGEAVGLLGRALQDEDRSVRHVAIGSIADMGLPIAKSLLMDKVRSRSFRDMDYEDKKEIYRALLCYDDEEVRRLLAGMLSKEGFFRQAKNDEIRAAIAYNVGCKGLRDFLPHLQKLTYSGNDALRLTAHEAIRKIEHGT